MDRETTIRLTAEKLPHTSLGALGIRIESHDSDAVRLALDIDDRHRQPMGLLHGGISALLAESAASIAAALEVDPERFAVMGVDLNATHLKAKRAGTITATARPLHRGRTLHVYAVDINDEGGELVCAARCTIAVRPLRSKAESRRPEAGS